MKKYKICVYSHIRLATAPTTPIDGGRQFVHTGDECIPSVSLRCSQDSRSFHQRIEISEILTEPQSLCPDWLMKADKSDEKIPTQTICTLGAIFNIYIQLFQLSFASTQKYAKYFCTDLRRSR